MKEALTYKEFIEEFERELTHDALEDAKDNAKIFLELKKQHFKEI